jgi:hypothetical protein
MSRTIDQVPNGSIARIEGQMYLSTSGVATYFGWSIDEVYARRKLGLGPTPIKIGHGNWYPYQETEDWRGQWFEGGVAECPQADAGEASRATAAPVVLPPRSEAALRLEGELRQAIITDGAKHREFLFLCMEKVVLLELDAARANAVTGLSAEVHKSMKQSTDMLRDLGLLADGA